MKRKFETHGAMFPPRKRARVGESAATPPQIQGDDACGANVAQAKMPPMTEVAISNEISAEIVDLLARRFNCEYFDFLVHSYFNKLDEPNTITHQYFDARIAGIVSGALQNAMLMKPDLNRAVQLFALARLEYHEGHRPLFYMLVNVFTNRVCEVIFDARLRGVTDYSEEQECIDSIFAKNLIWQLTRVKHQDRVSVFFDALEKFRRRPLSKKNRVEIDVAQYVLRALNAYCDASIKAIQTVEDYEKNRQMIRRLKMAGGDQIIFDAIKDPVAAAIESDDWASMRHYHTLMREIWQALAQPQLYLDDFTKKLQSSKGYQRIASQAIQALSATSTRKERNAPCSELESGAPTPNK